MLRFSYHQYCRTLQPLGQPNREKKKHKKDQRSKNPKRNKVLKSKAYSNKSGTRRKGLERRWGGPQARNRRSPASLLFG
uniref:Uncharacterized protein MANES_01G179700 n=1 Tax=Rhizophora mucronata TaxID=61149 RepID=A0A2P2K0G6_RHIMU